MIATRRRWWADRERGSASTELVLVTPLLVVLMLFVVLADRLAHADLQVNSAAHQAARAASLTRSPPEAQTAALRTAQASLADQGLTCTALTVDTDTSQFRPGGVVTVSVTCAVSLADLAGLGVPGATVVHARHTSPLDRFRGITTGARP